MRKAYLEVGKIVTTHGIQGEVRVYPWCDTPEFLAGFRTLYLQNGKKPLSIERARVHKNVVVLKIEGVDTVEEAAKLRDQVLYIDREDAQLADGAFFIQDLLGLPVFDADTGKEYGVLDEVLNNGASDIYQIKDEVGKLYLMPAVKEMVVSIDLVEEKILVRPVKGIFDDAD